MIRAVILASLMSLLVIVFYIPSMHPPEHFTSQVHSEHLAATARWGPQPAHRILHRAMEMQAGVAEASPVPPRQEPPKTVGSNTAVTAEMTNIHQRLFGNAYFRSVDALFVLASYRFSVLLEWLPWLLPLTLVALIDGALMRVIRAKELRQNNPEAFALCCSLVVLATCGAVIACVLPFSIHHMTMAGFLIGLSLLTGRALTHYPCRTEQDLG